MVHMFKKIIGISLIIIVSIQISFSNVGEACGSTSPCSCGIGCTVADGSPTPDPGAETVDLCSDGDKRYEYVSNITVTSLNDTSFRVGDTIEICIDVLCEVGGDRFSMGYRNDTFNWVNEHVIFSTGGTGSGSACSGFQQYCYNQTISDFVGTHYVRGSVVYNGIDNSICHEPIYYDHDDISFEVLPVTTITTTTTTESLFPLGSISISLLLILGFLIFK